MSLLCLFQAIKSGFHSELCTLKSLAANYSLGNQSCRFHSERAVRKVAVGISGGVDSAVAALILKSRGFDVTGIFMRNWDEAEEKGNMNCSIEYDLRYAKAVCAKLGIPLLEANFIDKYYNEVFQTFLSRIEKGFTPNPDLDCNRYIKFSALLDFASSKGIYEVATGHYARIADANTIVGISKCNNQKKVLLRGIDQEKDQSYFLASIDSTVLDRIIFPLGDMLKSDVRKIAEDAKLPPADRKSSTGICFIGKRNFNNFITEYIPDIPGSYYDVDTQHIVGKCHNILSVTYGQGSGVGGLDTKRYVVGKDIEKKVVYVAAGNTHKALFTTGAALGQINWLSKWHEQQYTSSGAVTCQYKARYRQTLRQCTLLTNSTAVASSEFSTQKSCLWDLGEPGSVLHWAHFKEPAFAITPDQVLVLYDGDICLGSANIIHPTRTLHETSDKRLISESNV